MTEQNAQPARPIAPGPSLEEQLRKAVEDRPNRRIAAHPDLGAPFRGTAGGSIGGDIYGAKTPAPTPMPTGAYIASRLARLLDRVRDTEARCESIAVTLAGPAMPNSLGQRASEVPPPAASLFVIYERTLDEIDRIIDNIESEQARTRNILGE